MRRKLTSLRDPHRCENCAYFYQHYTLREDRSTFTFQKVNGGHCKMPRLKFVDSYQTCEGFKDKNAAED